MKRILKWILKTVGEDTLREIVIFILNRASDELVEWIIGESTREVGKRKVEE